MRDLSAIDATCVSSIDQARGDLSPLACIPERLKPENTGINRDIRIVPLAEKRSWGACGWPSLVSPRRPPSACPSSSPCTNVAQIALAREQAQAARVVIRTAIGAGRAA